MNLISIVYEFVFMTHILGETYEMGKYPFLDSFMLNYFSILSMYMDWDNTSNILDQSL